MASSPWSMRSMSGSISTTPAKFASRSVADVILLNKTDLVPAAELEKTEARIRKMNPMAKIYRTQDAAIDLHKVLDIGGFDLKRALELEPDFLKATEEEHDHDHDHEEHDHEHGEHDEHEHHDHHHDEDVTSVGIS